MADERLIAALTRERFGTPDRRTFRAAGRTTFTSPPIVRPNTSDTPDAVEERRRILCQALDPTNIWREAADAARQAEKEALTAARRAATGLPDTDTVPDNVVYLSEYRGAA